MGEWNLESSLSIDQTLHSKNEPVSKDGNSSMQRFLMHTGEHFCAEELDCSKARGPVIICVLISTFSFCVELSVLLTMNTCQSEINVMDGCIARHRSAWLSGRTSVFGQRSFAVLPSTCS